MKSYLFYVSFTINICLRCNQKKDNSLESKRPVELRIDTLSLGRKFENVILV